MIHRITGRHLFGIEFGAALWVEVQADRPSQVDAVYQGVTTALKKLNLHRDMVLSHKQIYQQWVFILAAPVDLLYTACSILEWSVGLVDDFSSVEREYANEENLAWRTLRSWALAQQVPCVDDEDGLTLGMGCTSQTWSLDNLPDVSGLNPTEFSRIPTVYITGTNGKTTSSRMLSAICQADTQFQGVGQTSTDGVCINGDWIERGDWTGPGAARMILRDPRVDVAILETARGGLMRRGLVLNDVDACAITNVSDDHLGTWGIHTVADMAMAKLTVALGVKEGGTVWLNADCAVLMEAWKRLSLAHPERNWDVALFSSQQQANMTLFVENGWIVHKDGGRIVRVVDIPLTLGGRAQYNIENAMVAIGLALSMGGDLDAIREGVCRLVPTMNDSRGRSNWLRYKDADVFLDFAHNPDGIRRVVEMGVQWQAERKGIVLGQAGDRTDAEILGIGYQAAILEADAYFLKELPDHAYGRDPSEVVKLLAQALMEKGVHEEQLFFANSDLEGAEQAMDWVKANDLLILLSHEQLDDVTQMVLERGCTWGHLSSTEELLN